MKRRKKTITLRGIRHLWKRTGRRPVEVPLVTRELVDKVIAQPRQSSPITLQMPDSSNHAPSTLGNGHRLQWMVAASVVLLVAAGITSLIRTSEVSEAGLATAQTEPIFMQESGQALPSTDVQSIVEAATPPHTAPYTKQDAMVEKKHEWQTAQKPIADQEGHRNGGIVCYSGGSISDCCDEETVTNMLLAFL